MRLAAVVVLAASAALAATEGQSAGNATSLRGTGTDVTGAIVLSATVKIHNPVSGFERTKQTDERDVLEVELAGGPARCNFLSTFSGTHYVSPRALTAQLGLHF